jgi:hypothetical protein
MIGCLRVQYEQCTSVGSPVQGKAIALMEAKLGEILALLIALNFASELPRIDICSQR